MQKRFLFFLIPATFLVFTLCHAQTAQWAWIGGNNTDRINQPSVYGIKGVAGPANKPGGRNNSVSWTDASGNFWLFGGIGQTSSPTSGGGELNDLWKYTPLTNLWTWKGGYVIKVQSGGKKHSATLSSNKIRIIILVMMLWTCLEMLNDTLDSIRAMVM